ncbi:BglG family transcription antiterminator [Facklamia sp. DSM 111018]|uniref:Ascorbate-specific PTS system EIIA component n=1 Tax=Facklamia lactis TaxID=2749967 RepID=A0ABS0LS79_9LACT|nr:BglG family transcription antiterminator [Facklamia lactis]MBG9986859.1 BglG family transcription antiterminator [Facklamia lactis]
MLNNDIIKKLPIFSQYNGYAIADLERILTTSRKNILMDIERINEVLSYYDYPLVTTKEDRISLPPIAIKDLFVRMSPEMSQYYFQEERVWMILLYLFLEEDYISNFHLQSYLRVSKNTVLSDIKNVREFLTKEKVQLAYSRKLGYYLEGESLKVRAVLEKAVNEILKFESGKWIIRYTFYACQVDFEIDEIIEIFLAYTQQNQLSFIAERIEATSYLMLFLLKINKLSKWNCCVEEVEMINRSNVLDLVDHFVSRYPKLATEKYFIASRLLGCIQGDFYLYPDQQIVTIMNQIIELVSANTGIVFRNDEQFKMNLYNHLAPAYYRLSFEMTLLNPLKEQIISEYSSLFYLVKKSLSPLSEALQKEISEDEIAYFTMHFGGYITACQEGENQRQIVALAVCPNGVSSSLILTSELRNIMPEIDFKSLHQLELLPTLPPREYDLIFSTVYFETDKPLFVVQPFMNPVEKSLLKKKVYREFQIKSEDDSAVDEMMKIIAKHCQVQDEMLLRNELLAYQLTKNENNVRWEGISLNDLLQLDRIQMADRVDNWQSGIELAAQPLLEKGFIEASYIEAMIDSIHQLGAYIVLAPRVAVPHASPDKGVKRLGMSLLQLKEAVDFNRANEEYDEDRQVHLIFVLAAIDSSAHLRALQQLVMILDNEETIDRLIKAETCDEMYQIINECLKDGE